MNRRRAGLLIAAAAIALGVALYLLLRDRAAGTNGAGTTAAVTTQAEPVAVAAAVTVPAPDLERWTARLYYPAASDRLVIEEREIESGESASERASGLLRSLLATAPAAPRVPLFPAAVEVGRVLLDTDATLIVDLKSTELPDPPSSGSTVELLRVYSIVHTLLRNIPEAGQVAILWNGRQRPSFAGHVDTARPLRARAELDAPAPRPAANPVPERVVPAPPDSPAGAAADSPPASGSAS